MNPLRILWAWALVLVPLSALGSPITFSMTSGTRSASAEFGQSGSDLIVTLTNTSTADAEVPTDILTGVFFEIAGDPLLVPTSAILPPGGAVLVGGTAVDVTPVDGVVGGEWAYLNNLSQVPSANSGISSSGLGVFGPADRFPGANLQGPTNPAGLQFGITSASDDLLTGNGGLSGEYLIKSSVVFTLAGYNGEPNADILHVFFQYGTALDEPRLQGHTPEPSSLVLLVFGIGGLGAFRYRRRKAGGRA